MGRADQLSLQVQDGIHRRPRFRRVTFTKATYHPTDEQNHIISLENIQEKNTQGPLLLDISNGRGRMQLLWTTIM